MKHKLLIITALVPFVMLVHNPKSHAVDASFMEGQFEEVMYIPQVNNIEAWEQPKTKYTPKNLRSEYQIRYSGSDTNGRNSYSYTTHFTDYDTYVTENGITEDGKYYVRDNTGKGFVTGEVAKDYDPQINSLNESVQNVDNKVNNNTVRINNNTQAIHNNTQQIKANTNNINSLGNRVDGINQQVGTLNKRVDNIDNRLDSMNSQMKQGFATVTALTSLHPNPRSNEKLEVSFGTGIYMDTMAGAVGLFYHPNDRVQVYAGGAYGGHDSWAGGAGITFSLGGRKHARH